MARGNSRKPSLSMNDLRYTEPNDQRHDDLLTRLPARPQPPMMAPTIPAPAKGKQRIEDTGPLTKKRMETIDDETSAAAIDLIKRLHAAGKPFFCWWNGTHAPAHTRAENRDKFTHGDSEYIDGMIEHDITVGTLLKALDELHGGYVEFHRGRPVPSEQALDVSCGYGFLVSRTQFMGGLQYRFGL